MIQTVVLVEERYQSQAQPAGLINALHRYGASVTVLGDQHLAELPSASLPAADVVVARGRSDAVLSTLAHYEQHGVVVVDRAQAIAAVRDKSVMTRRLERTGLPLPRTWLGTPASLARRLDDLDDRRRQFPAGLIVKPVHGDNSYGVHWLPADVDLRTLSEREGLSGELGEVEPLLLQEFIPGTGADLKLYVIGEHMWAVRKPSPVTPCTTQRLGPVELTPQLRWIGQSCAAAFGLRNLGVDCVEVTTSDTEEPRLMVIEVNDFPNYTAVPQADDHLAHQVLSLVQEVR